MAAITICSDFGAQKIKSDTVSTISTSICYEVMRPDAMFLVFWKLSFKPTFSLSSFTFIKKLFSSSLSAIRVVLSSYLRLLIFFQQPWFQLVLHPAAQLFSWCTLHISQISMVTIYSLDILLSLFGTSLLFHIQFSLLLPDLHTDFSRGRSGGLVFLSLSEFSTVCGDPHDQKLWHSQ